MFGVSALEAAVIVVIGLLVVGPERLPVMIRDAVRWVRDLKRVVDSARRDLTDQLGPELRDLGMEDLRELDPRTYVRRNVLDGLEGFDDLDGPGEHRAPPGSGRPPRQRPRPRPASNGSPDRDTGALPAFDPDAT